MRGEAVREIKLETAMRLAGLGAEQRDLGEGIRRASQNDAEQMHAAGGHHHFMIEFEPLPIAERRHAFADHGTADRHQMTTMKIKVLVLKLAIAQAPIGIAPDHDLALDGSAIVETQDTSASAAGRVA